MHRCIIDGNRETGIGIVSGDATIDTTVVRRTQPQRAANVRGHGIDVVSNGTGRGVLTLRDSLVEDCMHAGVLVDGSDVTISGVIVRRTAPQVDGTFGVGLVVQNDTADSGRSNATISSSVLDGNSTSGFYLVASDAVVDHLLVRGTTAEPSDGYFGDGVTVFAQVGPATLTMTASRIESNVRAGLSSFGGAVSIATSTFECNAFHLDGEAFAGVAYSFTDGGGNACGCNGTPVACQVLTSGLAAPSRIDGA
jgi:hypothetical protein